MCPQSFASFFPVDSHTTHITQQTSQETALRPRLKKMSRFMRRMSKQVMKQTHCMMVENISCPLVPEYMKERFLFVCIYQRAQLRRREGFS
jgi:hypothetical protein